MNMTQIKQLVDDAGGVFNAEDQHSPEHFVLDADAIKAFVGLLQPTVGDDVSSEFEKWSKSLEFFDWVTTEEHAKLNFNAGYQACAQRYEAERNALLAVVEKHREALITFTKAMEDCSFYPDTTADINGLNVAYSNCENSLALTPENVRLVEVGTVSNNDVFLHSDLRGGDTKLYTIEAQP